jgi:hypothetical protein
VWNAISAIWALNNQGGGDVNEMVSDTVQRGNPFVAFLRRLAMFLASGYILMFFSEFYFLNEGPGLEFVNRWTNDPLSIPGWLGSLSLYYAGWGGIMLVCIDFFRVRNFWSLFIAGALFGWAVEGIVIPLIYGAMPGTIGWPSLGWHVIVDVMLGWYLVRRILQKNKHVYTIILSVALGLFWGLWCTWYWGEPADEPAGERQVAEMAVEDLTQGAPATAIQTEAAPEVEEDGDEEPLVPLPGHAFPAYALVLGALLIGAYMLIDKAGGGEFKPTIVEILVLAVWHVWCFYHGVLQMAPVAIYVLPMLFAGGFLVLWWNRRMETRPTLLRTLTNRVGWGQYALLLLMPVCAIPVYVVLYTFDIHIPILPIVAIPLMFAGNILLFASVLMIAVKRLRPSRKDESQPTAKASAE